MKSRANPSTSQPSEVVQFTQNWQLVRPEHLPSLFYAYDAAESQSERLVTFELQLGDLDALYDSAKSKNAKKLEFIVHLAVTEVEIPRRIPDVPIFTLFIQASEGKEDFKKDCFQMKWAPNARFTNNEADSATSGLNAIPAASAYMFVMSWMEMPERDLATPFTAVSHVLGKRVKNYRFSNAESLSILKDIGKSLSSRAPGLHIHLGNGLAVYDHPFSFRPVIEVRHAVEVDPDGVFIAAESGGRNSTGLLNDYGDSFYDFGLPEPPPQPEG